MTTASSQHFLHVSSHSSAVVSGRLPLLRRWTCCTPPLPPNWGPSKAANGATSPSSPLTPGRGCPASSSRARGPGGAQPPPGWRRWPGCIWRPPPSPWGRWPWRNRWRGPGSGRPWAGWRGGGRCPGWRPARTARRWGAAARRAAWRPPRRAHSASAEGRKCERAEVSASGRKCERLWARRGAAEMAAAKRKHDGPAARPKKRAKRAPSAPEPDAKAVPDGAGTGEYSIPPPVSQVPPSPAAEGGAAWAATLCCRWRAARRPGAAFHCPGCSRGWGTGARGVWGGTQLLSEVRDNPSTNKSDVRRYVVSVKTGEEHYSGQCKWIVRP